jgi:hypothetical protein
VIMLAYLFLAVAIAVRYIPHPWMFTPVTGALLYFGARGSRRYLWVPLVAMMASDVVLTKVVYAYPFVWDHFVTWAWYAAVLWLGTRLRANAKPLPVIGAALASSVSFFVISNFAVWAAYDMYPKNFGGLMTSYTLALPFFRHAVEGDLLFTAAFFATPVVLAALSEAFGHSDHTAAA